MASVELKHEMRGVAIVTRNGKLVGTLPTATPSRLDAQGRPISDGKAGDDASRDASSPAPAGLEDPL